MVQIFELLGKKTVLKLLRYFLKRPTATMYAEQLGKELKMAKKSLFDGLHKLLEAGVLRMETVGRTKRYGLDRSNPVVKELKVLLTLDTVMPLLKKLEGMDVEAYLYGSAARGEDVEKSDIDLLLIGHKTAKEALAKVGKLEKLRPVYLTFVEYSRLARSDPAYYERIERDKIRLL
ncbi:MAG: nucleotidyltransferase domain-containing protein [Candidatus Micrarchaeota archaeon]